MFKISELFCWCGEPLVINDKISVQQPTIKEIILNDEEGNEIGEGMLGARADITDFCHKEPVFTYHDKLIETLEKLNVTLSNFNTNTTQKGGNEMKFEELLAKYGKTAEEVTFEIEGLSDEELEAKFVEAFEGDGDDGEGADNGEGDEGTGDIEDGEGTGEGDGNGEEGAGDGAGDDDGEGSDDGDGAGEEKFTKIFTVELSHDDIRYALYNLISQYDEEDNDYYTLVAQLHETKDWKEANASDGFPCEKVSVVKTDFHRQPFMGIEVYMPIKTHEWLVDMYSETYMTPIKNWSEEGHKTRRTKSTERSYRKLYD